LTLHHVFPEHLAPTTSATAPRRLWPRLHHPRKFTTAAWLPVAARCALTLADDSALLCYITGEGSNLERLSLSLLEYATSICLPDTHNSRHLAPNILLNLSTPLKQPAALTLAPRTIIFIFYSDTLTIEPGFKLLPAEWQMLLSIPCAHAVASQSLTLMLLIAANLAVRCQALFQVPPPRIMLLWCSTSIYVEPLTTSHVTACPAITNTKFTSSSINAVSRLSLSSTREPL
jgi:hypothetical protein